MSDANVLVIVEIEEVLNPAKLQAYLAGSREKAGEHSGALFARDAVVFEGRAPTGPVIIQQWPSEQAFRDWQASDSYRPLLDIRREAARFRILIVPVV